jgi:hypothetical protein
VAWRRYEGRALADSALTGDARDAELESFIRRDNAHLTDVRLDHATETTDYDLSRRWYRVTYLADDGAGGEDANRGL